MADLIVRKAKTADMAAVLDFYGKMIDEMQGTDFDILWKHDVHPTNAFLQDSVRAGYLYLGIADDGNIACALVIDHAGAPGYEKVDWEVNAPAPEIGVVHIVATRPAYHGRGYASKLLTEAMAQAKAEGMKALRLDTFVHNDRAHGLYGKLGFINHGPWPIAYDDLGVIQLDMFEYVFED